MATGITKVRAPVTPDMVARRTVRFRDIKFSRKAHLDAFIPGHEREVAAVIGPGAMEDADQSPSIVTSDNFHVADARAKPGNGNALHDHETVEVFIPLSGRWSIRYGEDGEHEAILDPFDCISIPPGILRCFKNVGDSEAILMAIVGGEHAGHPLWSKSVIEAAARNGAKLDANGQIITA